MSWKRYIPFLRPHGTADKPLIDQEYIEESLDRSPVPIVLVLVLVWVVSAVLLLLSENRQRDLTVWASGQKSPFSFSARIDFAYEDSSATAEMRSSARNNAPLVCRIIPENTKQIKLELEHFFSTLQSRETMEQEKKLFVPADTTGAELAAKVIDYRLLLTQLRSRQQEFYQQLEIMLRNGIASDELFSENDLKRRMRVISPDDKNYDYRPPTASECADKLADMLKLTGSAKTEFTYCIKLMMEQGNLKLDRAATEKSAETAALAVKPVFKTRQKGERLVERQQYITREIADMLQAEKNALPRGYGMVLLCNRLGLSFLLLAVGLFFLYRTYPKIFQNPRRFAIAGLALILGLLANYGAIQLFFYFFRYGFMPEYDLMLFMMPLPFGAALLSILLGNRTALFAGFLVAALSSLMILPDRSLELALRWFAIVALMALAVRNVSNYRSFFVKVLFGGIMLTLLVNCDILYSLRHDTALLKTALIAAGANALICAIAALLAVFVFELVFNMDTTMSLMVLTDFNHPLLNRMRREAPGTMSHSMIVATLAEDAAAAIHANPARAKAAALFHDIGKLKKARNFVENNPESPEMYKKMPPQLGCSLIRGHVKDGLDLAREYRLCRFVRDAIATHHGDDMISFFYKLAQQQGNDEVLESQYRYYGEPPVDKELTILALADACEAASRSLKNPSPANIEELVNNIFIHRIEGGQLRNSDLTTSELHIVRKCFIEDLISLKHGRIAYNKEKEDDSAALPVDEPPTAAAEKK